MSPHRCPWWGGCFIDNPLRRLIHPPQPLLAPYLQAGMRAVDFGCGMGIFSLAMASLVGPEGRVFALDVQPQMLRAVDRRAAKAGLAGRVETHLCGDESIQFDQPVDFAMAFWSAHEVADPRRLLAELHGCLCPQGRLLLVEPRGHVSGRTFAGMLEMAGQLGLGVVDRPRVRFSHAALLSVAADG